MKNCLLYLLLFAFISTHSIAQTIVYSENFEGVTGRALPAGWTHVATDTPGWIGCDANTISSYQYYPPAHTHFAGINDDRFNTNLPGHNNINDKLTGPSFSLTAITLPFLQFAQFFGGQTTEAATVEVSVDGGTNWVYVDSAWATGMPLTWATRQISLQQFAGQANVKLRFGYSDGGGWQIGNSIDDIQVYQPTDYDVSVDQIQFPGIILNNTPLKVVVTNHGAQAITALSMNYSVSGGTPTSQIFTGLHIIPFTSDTLTFSANINGLATDASYTVTVNATLVNGNADANPNDNQASKGFIVATSAVQRAVLFEECTSSTCPPCAGFAGYYDPIWEAQGVDLPDSNFNIVKYQQNFPAPDDSSYNSYAGDRFSYYDMVGIPTPEMDGDGDGPLDPDFYKAIPAYLTLTANYIYKATKDSVYITITATPHFTAIGNYRLRVVLTEDHYQNPHNLNGELDYYDVERDMLPNSLGTATDTFVDGHAKTYTFKTKVTSGNVHKNSHTFWGNPANSHMVAFVQDDNTKEVLQSVISAPGFPVAISNISVINNVSVYPDPASTLAHLAFDISSTQNVIIRMTDITGHELFTTGGLMNRGMQNITIPTATLPTGLYIITINTHVENKVLKLNVVN